MTSSVSDVTGERENVAQRAADRPEPRGRADGRRDGDGGQVSWGLRIWEAQV